MYRIAITILLLSSSVLRAQSINRYLEGDWIQVGSKFDLSLGKGYWEAHNISYFRMSFQGNQVTLAYNPIEQSHLTHLYMFRRDSLVYGKRRFKLEVRGPNQMTLTQANETTPIHFQRLIPYQLNHLSPDSIYNASIKICPRYKGYLAKLFFDAGFIDFPAAEHDRRITAEFILMNDGSIQQVKIESNHAAWRNNLFRKALQKSAPNWQIPMINDKPVSTRVKFEVVRVGGKSIRNHQVAERYFNRALETIKSNPDNALKQLTMSIALEPNNAKYYFYRAMVYYFILNTEMMCENMVIARSLCPFLPLEFVDNTEKIQVKCFED